MVLNSPAPRVSAVCFIGLLITGLAACQNTGGPATQNASVGKSSESADFTLAELAAGDMTLLSLPAEQQKSAQHFAELATRGKTIADEAKSRGVSSEPSWTTAGLADESGQPAEPETSTEEAAGSAEQQTLEEKLGWNFIDSLYSAVELNKPSQQDPSYAIAEVAMLREGMLVVYSSEFVDLSWRTSKDAESYEISRNDEVIAQVSASGIGSYRDSNVKGGTNYRYAVSAHVKEDSNPLGMEPPEEDMMDPLEDMQFSTFGFDIDTPKEKFTKATAKQFRDELESQFD